MHAPLHCLPTATRKWKRGSSAASPHSLFGLLVALTLSAPVANATTYSFTSILDLTPPSTYHPSSWAAFAISDGLVAFRSGDFSDSNETIYTVDGGTPTTVVQAGEWGPY